MAYLNNKLLQLQGMAGGLLFRKVRNKIIVSAAPSAGKPKSAKQLKQQQRFRQAGIYAKQQMLNPEIKAAYEEAARYHLQPNAYNVAISDFFHAPVIHKVEVVDEQESVKIVIHAEDDFAVKEVSVALYNHNGAIIEQGIAVMQFNRKTWIYHSVHSWDKEPAKLLVYARDLPGNETVFESLSA